VHTCTGIGQAFIAYALNEAELANYLNALVWNRDLTR
jgi:hypothetical protein